MQKKKNGKLVNVLLWVVIAAALLLGAGLLLYPTVSNWYNTSHASRAVAGYEKAISDMSEIEAQAMLSAARAYNDSLYRDQNRWEPDEERHKEYEGLLDVTGTGIMGYIEIPCISVKLPIYHGTDEAVLSIAVGHMEGSSLPIGGLGAHTVLSGHSALPSAKLFTDLSKVQVGDTFYVNTLNETLTYQVKEINTVLPHELELLTLDRARDLCTLVTCTPYGVNSHRLLVTGERVNNPTA